MSEESNTVSAAGREPITGIDSQRPTTTTEACAAPELDDLLTTVAAAEWLQMSERELLARSRGQRAAIPAFAIGHRTKRYHPRTILAKLAREAGVPLETISASFGLKDKNQ